MEEVVEEQEASTAEASTAEGSKAEEASAAMVRLGAALQVEEASAAMVRLGAASQVEQASPALVGSKAEASMEEEETAACSALGCSEVSAGTLEREGASAPGSSHHLSSRSCRSCAPMDSYIPEQHICIALPGQASRQSCMTTDRE